MLFYNTLLRHGIIVKNSGKIIKLHGMRNRIFNVYKSYIQKMFEFIYQHLERIVKLQGPNLPPEVPCSISLEFSYTVINVIV